MLGASWSEIGLVALLVGIVLLAPVAPAVGAAIGGLFEPREGRTGPGDARADDAEPQDRDG
jgi:hypothetical protein